MAHPDEDRQKTVLNRYREGKITLREAAALLGVTYMEMDNILRKNRIPLVDDVQRALRRPTRSRTNR